MSWIWPANNEYQREVLSYVRFDFQDFDSDLEVRSKDIVRQWHSTDYVELPLPTRIGTDLNMDYTTNSSRISSDRNFMVSMLNPLNPVPGTLYDPEQAAKDRNIRLPGRNFSTSNPPSLNDSNDTNASFLDIIDTTWLGQSRRVYSFDFNMICKSIEDSSRAASVCNYMNSFALPRLNPMSKKSIVGNQKSIHPSMCAVHIKDMSEGGLTEEGATKYWLGEFPQLCVLQKVKGTRIGGDGNQILGMKVPNSGFVPIMYNLKLLLVELEPVYRGEDGIAKSRSQFFTEP
jgi:hypothetical protein